jgi:hypothetical protein
MCPQCHRVFSREVEEKEEIAENFTPVADGPAMYLPLAPIDRSTKYQMERVTYRYHYKCKHCGHEWTETRTEEITPNPQEKLGEAGKI